MDSVNATPKELPIATAFSASRLASETARAMRNGAVGASVSNFGTGVFSPGSPGTGQTSPLMLGVPAPSGASLAPVASEEFGTSNLVFSTAQADLFGFPTNDQYPYRASGKLFFNEPSGAKVCTASLIAHGVIVTAAHCVGLFGSKQIYSGWQFVPGYRNGVAPFGTWTAAAVRLITSYFDGTDSCAQSGVVCANDVAMIALAPQNGTYAGDTAGWYGYGWNNFGYNSLGQVQITQIGYPNCLDNGALMERNDSQGITSSSNSNNTIIGSLMCGGSSGGPWLIDFGVRPTLTGTADGTFPGMAVVGTTSWGSTGDGVKNMGASPFTDQNFPVLLNAIATTLQVHVDDERACTFSVGARRALDG